MTKEKPVFTDFALPKGYKKHFLEDDANAFILEKLEHGLTLSKEVRKIVDLTKSEKFVIFPQSIAYNDLLVFEAGGKLSTTGMPVFEQVDEQGRRWHWMQAPDTDYILRDFIEINLRDRRNMFCIFEDASVEPKDKCVAKKNATMRFCDNELYYVLDVNSSDGECEQVLKHAKSWMRNGFLFLASDEMKNDLRSKEILISQQQIMDIAHSVSHIFVSAYDGESNIICVR